MKGKLISMSLLLMVALITASGCATGLANIEPHVSAEPQDGGHAMRKKISLWQDGEEQVIDPLENPKRYIQTGDLLVESLHKLNLQARCVFSQERIDETKQKDTVVELIFREPVDITISKYVEEEERHHIATDENGYRILEKVKVAIFVLEDNLNEGLWAHEYQGKIGYGCWAIQQEGSNELDTSWVYEIASACELEIEAPSPGDEVQTAEKPGNEEFNRVSQEESEEIARNHLLNSPTCKFDGIEDSLELAAIYKGCCPYCWQFVFEFQCRHAGYGDRTGQMLAEVITPHTAGITVDQGEVVSAIMDDQWDMMKQKMIEKDTGFPEPEPIET